MNAMTGAVWADYLPPRCNTCKPGPDGSMTGVGWSLVAVGAVVVLLGICGLVFASASAGGSPADDDSQTDADTDADAVADADARDVRAAAESEPEPVMDAVQREDLERRGLLKPQTGQSEKSNTAWGGGVVAVGAVAAAFGLIVLAFSNSRIDDDKSQLRLAAADLVSVAFAGPANCRQLAVIESREWSSPSASTAFLPNAAHCDGSPRQYAEEGASAPAGVFLPIEYVFSSSFTANGEVTLHDKQDNRSMCVTLPDTDVAAAAQPSPSTDTDSDSGSLPEFDDVTVDPSRYVRDGACPDAPVS